MYRLHLTRNLRSLLFLLIVSAVVAGFGSLWWANRTGLPDSWRSLIEREASKQGAFLEIGSLRYIPLRGVIATDVRVFFDPEHLSELSRLEQVVLDFDKTKLARGILHLTRVELKDVRLTLPVNPKDPNSDILEVTEANGTLFMPGNRRLEVRGAHGKIAGIEVALDAQLIGYQQGGPKPPEDTDEGKRRALLAQIIHELNKWSFDEDQAPSLQVYVEGNANDRSATKAKLTLKAKSIGKNHHRLDEVTAEADMTGDLLTITSLRATDSSGVFEGHIDYNLDSREGRFDVSSSLEVPALLKAWLGIPALKAIEIRGRQTLAAEGDFQLGQDNIPEVRMTGHARCESVKLRGMDFDAVETAFSWRDQQAFLRDVRLIRADGEAHGKAMIQWPQVRLALNSSLPTKVYKPFFVGLPLAIVLNDFTARKGAAVNVSLEGGFDATDRHSWAYSGGGNLQNMNYKGVPVNHAECKFSLSHYELDFFDGKVLFNYEDYPLRTAFKGPKQGTAQVRRIRYDAPNKIVEVEAVSGDMWAAPMVRFFAPKVADSLEQYRFHHTPELKASGVVDVTPQGRTALDVSFKSDKSADYQFLGETITLGQPRGDVAIRGERVAISNLNFDIFGGPVASRFDYLGKGRLEGELSWTNLALQELASTYDFQMKEGGRMTGRINFDLTDGKVETMNGEGLLAMENAELFSVPMFGPLTRLVSSVLKDRRAGSERANDAFCNFTIQKGILSTHDFQTSTTSLNFTGDGDINLMDRTLNMTMRLNARGLLGLITLPLRPFYGLFQFRGSGPLKDATWESEIFTAPPDEQKQLLLAPPKAAIIREDR
ncbi:MAG: AsmA-like C-terminal region-containing protein [Akkermansiaceae bacterium]